MVSVSDAPRVDSIVGGVRPPRIAITLCALWILSACGGSGASEVDAAPPTAPDPVGAAPTAPVTTAQTLPARTTTTGASPEPDSVPVSTPAPVEWTAASTEQELDVFRAPGDAEPFRVLEHQTILGTPTVVLVLGGSDAWLEVLLPGRPNGETGWVRAMDVQRFAVTRQVIVDLTTRTLQVLEGDQPIFETAVGVGSPSAPTPEGTFFVTDAVRLTNPSGPWGPYAFGLSARSDTVTEFNGGDGIIGIHGTNRPNSIGEAQSLGCVRLPNEVMLQLAELVSVGSPVTIKA